MAFLFAIGIALAVWEIVVGLRRGEISGLGWVFAKAHRKTQPVFFWLILIYNAIFLAGFIFFFIRELKP